MKIVFVTQHYYPHVGGIEYTTHRTTKILSELGHECFIFAPLLPGTVQFEKDGNTTVIRLRSYPVDRTKHLNIVPFAQTVLVPFAAQIDPDVFHIQTPLFLGEAALKTARILNKPVLTTHHVMPENILSILNLPKIASGLVNILTYQEIISFYNKCDFLTAPTQAALDLIKEKGLEIPSKVVSNGIDIDQFRPVNEGENITLPYELKGPGPYFLYIGRLSKEKHVNTIIKAFAKVSSNTQVNLIIAGKGELYKSLVSLAKKLGVYDKITFTGYVPDEIIPLLYRKSYAYIIASTAELQSITTLEALASSKPVIATYSHALVEIIKDGYNGYTFMPQDIDDLAYKMQLLLSAENYEGMCIQARRTVQKHDIKKSAEQYIRLYKQLIRQNTDDDKKLKRISRHEM